MTFLGKTYAYKKGMRIITYAASLIATLAVLNTITASIRGERNFATFLISMLFLLIPLIALAVVNTKFALTNDGLIKKSIFGEKVIQWTEVMEIAEREGFFQKIVTLIDCHGRKMTLTPWQIAEGEELCAQVKKMAPKARY